MANYGTLIEVNFFYFVASFRCHFVAKVHGAIFIENYSATY